MLSSGSVQAMLSGSLSSVHGAQTSRNASSSVVAAVVSSSSVLGMAVMLMTMGG